MSIRVSTVTLFGAAVWIACAGTDRTDRSRSPPGRTAPAERPAPRPAAGEVRGDRQEVRADRKDIREDRKDLREDRKEIRQDRKEIREDRKDVRDAAKAGIARPPKLPPPTCAATAPSSGKDVRELREDKRDLREDKRDLRQDKRDTKQDARDAKQERREDRRDAARPAAGTHPAHHSANRSVVLTLSGAVRAAARGERCECVRPCQRLPCPSSEAEGGLQAGDRAFGHEGCTRATLGEETSQSSALACSLRQSAAAWRRRCPSQLLRHLRATEAPVGEARKPQRCGSSEPPSADRGPAASGGQSAPPARCRRVDRLQSRGDVAMQPDLFFWAQRIAHLLAQLVVAKAPALQVQLDQSDIRQCGSWPRYPEAAATTAADPALVPPRPRALAAAGPKPVRGPAVAPAPA